jgi:hypothetical protein
MYKQQNNQLSNKRTRSDDLVSAEFNFPLNFQPNKRPRYYVDFGDDSIQKPVHSYSNHVFAEIFEKYMIPFIYAIDDVARLKRVCKDFYERQYQYKSVHVAISENADKNTALKLIQNKSDVESLFLKFNVFQISQPFYEPNLFTQFTKLTNIKIKGYDDFENFDGVFRDIPMLKLVEFKECSLGDLDFEEIDKKLSIEIIRIISCDEIHEKTIIENFFKKLKTNFEFSDCAFIRDSFNEGFPKIQKYILESVRKMFLQGCGLLFMNPNQIPVATIQRINSANALRLIRKFKFKEETFEFISYE